MNVDTGEMKRYEDLTEEEKKSGKYFPIPGDTPISEIKELSKSELKRRAYMERAAQKRLSGENV